MIKSILKKLFLLPETAYLLLYAFAYFPILFNRGIYGDDWYLVGTSKEILELIFSERFNRGGFFFSFIHNLILSTNQGAWIYRAFTFVAYGLAALFLNSILRRVKEIDPHSRFFITVFFAIFPVNFARIAMMCFPYTLCYLIFYASFWALAKYLENKIFVYRILAILGFFISFTTRSFLVFYLTVFFYIIYYHQRELKNVNGFIRILTRYADFIFLPIVFWIIHILYCRPVELYQRYNYVSLKRVIFGFVASPTAYYYSFFNVIDVVFRDVIFVALRNFPFSFFSIILLAYLFIAKSKKIQFSRFLTDKWLLILGAGIFFIAVYPYYVVFAFPRLEFWASRNQLLVPLGASLMLFYGIKLLSLKLKLKNELILALYFTFITAFIAFDIKMGLDCQRDWYKQLSIIEEIKNSAIFSKNTTFLFNDQAADLNASNRKYEFYDYCGIIKYALGGETRFGISYKPAADYKKWKKLFTARYKLKDYVCSKPQYLITIKHGPYILNYPNTIKLMAAFYFKPQKFNEKIKNIVKLEYLSLLEAGG